MAERKGVFLSTKEEKKKKKKKKKKQKEKKKHTRKKKKKKKKNKKKKPPKKKKRGLFLPRKGGEKGGVQKSSPLFFCLPGEGERKESAVFTAERKGKGRSSVRWGSTFHMAEIVCKKKKGGMGSYYPSKRFFVREKEIRDKLFSINKGKRGEKKGV